MSSFEFLDSHEFVKGKVKNTGWPIDGHILTLGVWDYDNRSSYHLNGWSEEDDEAIMLTMFQSMVEAGMEDESYRDEFIRVWKAGEFEPDGVFCLDLDKIDVIESDQ